MTKRVVRALARKYKHVRKGVEEVMGGRVLDYDAKRILNRGIKQGREEGREKTLRSNLQILTETLGCDRETAMELLKIPPQERPLYTAGL